jgi:hypothetical protein
MPTLAIVFYKAKRRSDKILSKLVGQFVHVDLMVIGDRKNSECKEKQVEQMRCMNNCITYTIFIHECYSASISLIRNYNSVDNVALYINIKDDEYENVINYVNKLCESEIPYNYMDTACLLLPTSLMRIMEDDIDSSNVANITSLFCSQSVIVVLKNCLNNDNLLQGTIQNVNSRLTTPQMLYDILQSEGLKHCNADFLRTGMVVQCGI